MGKQFYIFLFLVIVLPVGILSNYAYSATAEEMEEMYQHDMDIVRLNDLNVMGELIEEYRKKKGHYPFENKYEYEAYVFITTKGQRKYAQGGPPYTHAKEPVKNFIAELEKGIGRHIDLPFDPQKVPVLKPNFYIYMVRGSDYFLAIHLYNEFSFTKKVSSHYNKVEITSNPKDLPAAWRYEDLMKNKDFIKASGEKMHKPGYVKAMRGKMYEEGAF